MCTYTVILEILYLIYCMVILNLMSDNCILTGAYTVTITYMIYMVVSYLKRYLYITFLCAH